MKTLLVFPALALAMPAIGARLQVDCATTKAVQTITYDCPRLVMERGGRDAEMLTTSGGMVRLDISGGTPPYSVSWDGEIGGGGSCFVSMPGRRTVTVVDAAGNRVTRTVHIGTVRRVVRRPCPPDQEDAQPVKVVPDDTVEVKARKRPDGPSSRKVVARKQDLSDSMHGVGSGTTVRRTRTEPVGTGRKPVRTAPVRR